MRKIHLRSLTIGSFVVIVLVAIVWMASKADNFWVNFSLNLSTEIIGAVLIAYYLKNNVEKGLQNYLMSIQMLFEKSTARRKFDRATQKNNPDVAWNSLLEFKKKELSLTIDSLNLLDPLDIKGRKSLEEKANQLKQYIKAAETRLENDYTDKIEELEDEFSKYKQLHPNFSKKIPDEAKVIILDKNDPGYNSFVISSIPKSQKGYVFVETEGLTTTSSRLKKPKVVVHPTMQK